MKFCFSSYYRRTAELVQLMFVENQMRRRWSPWHPHFDLSFDEYGSLQEIRGMHVLERKEKLFFWHLKGQEVMQNGSKDARQTWEMVEQLWQNMFHGSVRLMECTLLQGRFQRKLKLHLQPIWLLSLAAFCYTNLIPLKTSVPYISFGCSRTESFRR